MQISVSLIIPVYNVESYLVPCLDSVINQTIAFDEVIIINDGSTDHSLEICERYVSSYKYFKLINQENQGLSSARNRGILEISGEYVMFLDSDDSLRTDTVENLKDKLQKTKYDAVFFDAEIFSDETVLKNKKNIYDRSSAEFDGKVMSGEEYFANSYPENYIVSVCMAIYKTQLIKEQKIFFPEGLYFEDNYFYFVFLEYAKRVIHISQKLYYRRYRTGSITLSEYSEKKFLDHIKIGLLIWEEILKRKDTFSLEMKQLLLKYVSDYYYMIFERYKDCIRSHIQLNEKVKIELNVVAERYDFLLEALQLEKVDNNLLIFNRMLSVIYYTDLYIGKKLDEKKVLIQNTVEKQKRIYHSLLKKVPLNIAGCKVGIYGTGKHTKGLLTIYEKLFGEISCDLFFLDSYKNQGQFLGRDLVNYKKINLSTDLIVLSSFLYEREMTENIRSVSAEVPIYTFYSDIKGDIFAEYETFLHYW